MTTILLILMLLACAVMVYGLVGYRTAVKRLATVAWRLVCPVNLRFGVVVVLVGAIAVVAGDHSRAEAVWLSVMLLFTGVMLFGLMKKRSGVVWGPWVAVIGAAVTLVCAI